MSIRINEINQEIELLQQCGTLYKTLINKYQGPLIIKIFDSNIIISNFLIYISTKCEKKKNLDKYFDINFCFYKSI